MRYVLSIDVGSQSLRGCIFDQMGNLVAKVQEKYPPFKSIKTGWVEVHPEVFWQTFCKVCNKLKDEHPQFLQKVEAMSVDTFRDTAVLLDKDNNVVRDSLMWSDLRIADVSQPVPFWRRVAFALVGMTRTIHGLRKRIRTRWIKQNEPEIWAKTKKIVNISTFINYKLTGNLIDADGAQIGKLPFDYKNRKWSKKSDILFPLYEITHDYLVDLVPSGQSLGVVSQQASKECGLPFGLNVIATGSDKSCETLGTGCLQDNVASVSFGTSASIQFSTPTYFEPEPMLPSYPSVVNGYYNPEVQIFRGFWMVSWFVENFASSFKEKAKKEGVSIEELLDKEMEKIPAGCDGLMLQPFWQGGLTSPEARGAVIGFTDGHTRAHLYRAIIEGILFALREGLERLERRGKKHIEFITVSGGGSKSDIICQMCADVLGRPVKRAHTFENSALGTAIVTFTSIGVHPDVNTAVKEMVRYKDKFTPNLENKKVYDDLFYKVYLKMYKKLKKFYIHLEDKF